MGWGASRGSLHYDPQDNILIQVQGVKTVVVYPPNVTLALAAGGSSWRVPTSFPSNKFLCKQYTALKPMLATEARFVTLYPGMGLLLPSGAYHGPSGRSHDSLTINAFMSGNKFPINRYARSIPEIDRWHIEETELLKNPEYFRDLSQVRFGGGGGGVGHGGATSTSSWTKGPYDRILARVAHKIDQEVKQREAHGNHERLRHRFAAKSATAD